MNSGASESRLRLFQTNWGGTMTTTEICLLAWAILGITVVAILLGLPERRNDRGPGSNKQTRPDQTRIFGDGRHI